VRDVYGWTLADGCAVKLKELTSAAETFDRALKLARLLKDRAAMTLSSSLDSQVPVPVLVSPLWMCSEVEGADVGW